MAAQIAGGYSGKKYKVVLLGDSGVGKSCLVVRLCKDEFVSTLHSTVGSSFFKYTCELDDGSQVFQEIWDTAGQERFKSLARMYYRGAAGILVVYDITSVETFERAKLWVKELATQENAIITLVGNKVDMNEDRAVPKEEAAAFAAEAGILHAEASAKTGEGVKQIFTELGKKLAANAGRVASVGSGGVVRAPGAGTSGGGVKAVQQQEKKPCAC